jgi:lipopolysaccharide/colanic/teichoic acid biosynthesis glycosyltransferase
MGDMESLYQSRLHDELLGQVESTVDLLPRAGIYSRRVKPFVDFVGGVSFLIILSPIILISLGLVALSLGHPLIYRQDRIGIDGRPFKLYKLRTMTPDRRSGQGSYIGPERRQTHKSRKDPRVTSIGRLLRAVRFDELPQLWNVIKGDMSLVGPRPELPQIVAHYEEWQHRRHIVRPGLTGLWQVSHHNGKPMHECTEVDLEYIAAMSFASDVSIMMRTPAAMFHRRGY